MKQKKWTNLTNFKQDLEDLSNKENLISTNFDLSHAIKQYIFWENEKILTDIYFRLERIIKTIENSTIEDIKKEITTSEILDSDEKILERCNDFKNKIKGVLGEIDENFEMNPLEKFAKAIS